MKPTLLSALEAMSAQVKGAEDPLIPIARVLGAMTAHGAGGQAEMLHILLVAADNPQVLLAGGELPLTAPMALSTLQAQALLVRTRLLVSGFLPGGCNA
jgi:hypothetical protein